MVMLSEEKGDLEACLQRVCLIQVSEAKLFDYCPDSTFALFVLRMGRIRKSDQHLLELCRSRECGHDYCTSFQSYNCVLHSKKYYLRR